MKLPEFSVNNRAIILFAVILIAFGGVRAYFLMGKLEDPEFTIKTALIITPWPGASPHEVEQQVTDVVEKAVQATDELDDIHSISKAGLSIVYVDLKERNRTDRIQQLWDMLRRKVEGCRGRLPPGAGPSIVRDDYSDVYGIFLALTGDGFSHKRLKDYARYIKRELLLVPDVARIELFGERTESIDIEISRPKMARLGVHPGQIIETLNRQNEVIDAGALTVGSQRIRAAPANGFSSVAEIGDLVVQAGPEEQILLRDAAEIRRGYLEPPEPMMRFNGREAIGISISTASGANVVTMGDAVQRRIEEIMQDLPVGVRLEGVYYQSESVKKAIRKFVVNLIESVCIVIGVLLVAMGIRSGLLIGSGLVLSILGTLIVMLAWGIDLHRISLASLVLVMGMIVDNAIVVTDGTLVRLQNGEDRRRAVTEPARETAWPLLGATVIACVTFLPIYLSPTGTGEFCASLFQVVAIALGISWILAMTQTPVFCRLFLKVKKKRNRDGAGDPLAGRSHRVYRRLLLFSLRHRWAVLLSMLVLSGAAGFGFRYVPQKFFSDSDKAMFMIDYWIPEGSSIQKVSEDLRRVESHLASLPEITRFASCIGAGAPRYYLPESPENPNTSYGQLIVGVEDYRKIPGLARHLERWFLDHLPHAEPVVRRYIEGPGVPFRVEARFSGPDPAVLRDLSRRAREVMRSDPLAVNIRDDWRQRVKILAPVYSQARARRALVERRDLAMSLGMITDGALVSFYRENEDLIPVFVKAPAPEKADLDNLANIPVWGRGAARPPLGQVVSDIGVEWEDPIIRRYNRRRAITVQCNADGASPDTLLARLRPAIEAIELPRGYTLEWAGEWEISEEGKQGMARFAPLALIIIALILVSLFNGFRQPLIIALVMPLAAVGVTAGLFFTGESFGFLALLGTYSLVGMMVKNAVVLLDRMDAEIDAGVPPHQAVVNASVGRMRPVLMASVTTIFGMIPLLTDPMFSSMAVTIMFGLAFASVLTLIVVPILYSIFFRVKSPKTEKAKPPPTPEPTPDLAAET